MTDETPEAILVTRKVVVAMRNEHPNATKIGPFISYKEDGKWISTGQIETKEKILFYRLEVGKTAITVLSKNVWPTNGDHVR